MAKARKKASKRRSKAKRNPLLDYPEGWRPVDARRWAAGVDRAEVEERLELVREELESPSSEDGMYFVNVMMEVDALELALKQKRHTMRQEPKAISGEIIVNPWARRSKKRRKSKRRAKAKKNPALISAKELGYFYEDGERDFSGSSLVGQDMSGMDLRGANFRKANLYSVNFSGADLRGVDFRGAELGATDFRGAKADLNTLMEGASLDGSQGPPDYYDGDTQVTFEQLMGGGAALFDVQMVSEDEYHVAPTPGSPMEGQIKPQVFTGPSAMSDAIATARDLAATAATMEATSEEDAEHLRDVLHEMDAKAVRIAKENIKRVESMEPFLGGRPLDSTMMQVEKILRHHGLDDRVEVVSYAAIHPIAAPMYLKGPITFADPNDGQEFLDDLLRLGVRMPYAETDGPKPVIPKEQLEAAEWSDYLDDYTKALEDLQEARGVRHNPRRRAKTPEWKRLINRCQGLWEAYDKKPLKKNLLAFGKHIDKMKDSRSARVRAEARRAVRAYNAEFKARGWKKPAAKKKAKKKATKKAKKPAKRNPYRGGESLDALQTRYWEEVGVLDRVRRAIEHNATVTVMRSSGELEEGEIRLLRDAEPGMVVTVRLLETPPGHRHPVAIDKHVALKRFIGMNWWLFHGIDDPNPPEAWLRARMEGVPNPHKAKKKAKKTVTRKPKETPRTRAEALDDVLTARPKWGGKVIKIDENLSYHIKKFGKGAWKVDVKEDGEWYALAGPGGSSGWAKTKAAAEKLARADAKKTAKKKAKKKPGKRRRRNAMVGKAKFMSEMQKLLDGFRKKEKKLMEKEGISYEDPLADVFLRDEGDRVVLYYDGRGYDYLSMNSEYQTDLPEKIVEKADKLGWTAEDDTHFSMEFRPG